MTFSELPPQYPPVLPAEIETVARTEVMVAGTTIGWRRGIDFVASTGTTITAVDDATNEKVTITVSSSVNSTGDIKESLATADHGSWLILQGGSFSGATWPNLQTLLGGTTLPDMRGRSPMGSGTGSGLTARTLKLTYGAEGVIQTLAQIAQHSHTLASSHTHDMAQHSHTLNGHSHGLNSHTHSLSSHVHGLNGGAQFINTGTGTGVGTDSLGGTAMFKTALTVTPEASGSFTNTTGAPGTGSGAGFSATTVTANSTGDTAFAGAGTGQAAINETNTANAGNSGTTPGSGATAMDIVHPVYTVNFFIYAG